MRPSEAKISQKPNRDEASRMYAGNQWWQEVGALKCVAIFGPENAQGDCKVRRRPDGPDAVKNGSQARCLARAPSANASEGLFGRLQPAMDLHSYPAWKRYRRRKVRR